MRSPGGYFRRSLAPKANIRCGSDGGVAAPGDVPIERSSPHRAVGTAGNVAAHRTIERVAAGGGVGPAGVETERTGPERGVAAVPGLRSWVRGTRTLCFVGCPVN